MMAASAASHGLLSCHTCGLVSKSDPDSHEAWCPRCAAALHFRKPDSISRTWALLIASVILYVPANVMPVMETSSLLGAHWSVTVTILLCGLVGGQGRGLFAFLIMRWWRAGNGGWQHGLGRNCGTLEFG